MERHQDRFTSFILNEEEMSRSDPRKRPRKSSSSSSSENDQHRPKKNDDGTWLNTLTEREREAELLKRHEESERVKHHEEIRKRLQSQGKQSDSENESKKTSRDFDQNIYADGDSDNDDRPLPYNRQQINASKQKQTAHTKTLQALIEERKKKQEKIVPKRTDVSSSDEESTGKTSKNHEKWKVNDVYNSSSSEESEDDTRRRNRRSRSRSPKDKDEKSRAEKSRQKKLTPINSKDQLKTMILTRFRMEKWCHAPFFADVAKGAFVRINIGQNNGAPVYRICEIRDVVETGKIYNLGSTRTNKGLRLKHGDHERVFRLEFVSNKEISDAEFTRWREALMKKGSSLPTLKDLEEKETKINECKRYAFSQRDITRMVEEKDRFRKTPINYAMKKNELLKEIDMARDENDQKKEKEIKKKLDEMEERAAELDRRRSEKISVIAQINQRNRKKTQQNIEMALIRQAKEQQGAAADPFTRRRCEPTLVTRAPQTKDDLIRELQTRRAAEEAAAAAKKKKEEQRLFVEHQKTHPTHLSLSDLNMPQNPSGENSFSRLPTRDRGSLTTFSAKIDDLFSSHDFELDVPIQFLPD